MKITELLGRIARAKDRLSMAQKNAGFVFNYLVGRAEWDYETANGVRNRQQTMPNKETLDHAISQLEDALHDLKLVKAEIDDRAARGERWRNEG